MCSKVSLEAESAGFCFTGDPISFIHFEQYLLDLSFDLLFFILGATK